MAQLAEPADRLHPAEALLDELPFLLAPRVAGLTRRPTVDGAAAIPGGAELRDVRRRPHAPELRHKVAAVVALVRRHRAAAAAQATNQRNRGLALAKAIRRRDRGVHDQTAAVFHQHMPEIPESRGLAGGLLVEPCVWIGGRLMRRVAPALA